ncbi:hypothetical protein HHI36_015980 [Cryptolaemus montrouzieri]|uniref:Uncharacterized protein n=1 Tax=Cryptolaemus montrouzieri TaxID=559131 RepID=A0ABD2N7M2_9CUCU
MDILVDENTESTREEPVSILENVNESQANMEDRKQSFFEKSSYYPPADYTNYSRITSIKQNMSKGISPKYPKYSFGSEVSKFVFQEKKIGNTRVLAVEPISSDHSSKNIGYRGSKKPEVRKKTGDDIPSTSIEKKSIKSLQSSDIGSTSQSMDDIREFLKVYKRAILKKPRFEKKSIFSESLKKSEITNDFVGGSVNSSIKQSYASQRGISRSIQSRKSQKSEASTIQELILPPEVSGKRRSVNSRVSRIPSISEVLSEHSKSTEQNKPSYDSRELHGSISGPNNLSGTFSFGLSGKVPVEGIKNISTDVMNINEKDSEEYISYKEYQKEKYAKMTRESLKAAASGQFGNRIDGIKNEASDIDVVSDENLQAQTEINRKSVEIIHTHPTTQQESSTLISKSFREEKAIHFDEYLFTTSTASQSKNSIDLTQCSQEVEIFYSDSEELMKKSIYEYEGEEDSYGLKSGFGCLKWKDMESNDYRKYCGYFLHNNLHKYGYYDIKKDTIEPLLMEIF